VALRCSYFPDSKSGSDTSGLKPKGVIHWVDGGTAVPARVRTYDHLFTDPAPDFSDLDAALNPGSLVEHAALLEPAITASAETRFQFERQGYFHRDAESAGLYHRTVTLRDGYRP
jgi:glutaminyl-tRNA synthetase